MLPDKPSELIRLALDDLAAVEAQPDAYTVNMTNYHSPMRGTCFVCLAGAVMAKTMAVDISEWFSPSDLDDRREADKLRALDCFRCGMIGFALSNELYLPRPEGVPDDIYVTPYSESPANFRADMLDLATLLEEHGL